MTTNTITNATTIHTISQSLYDETLLENQEIFELSDADAITETISQFTSQKINLDNIITLHPNTPEGAKAREYVESFTKELDRLDEFVSEGGEVMINTADEVSSCLECLERIRMRLKPPPKTQSTTSSDNGDGKPSEPSENNNEATTIDPIALLIRSGGIFTLMSLISATDDTIKESSMKTLSQSIITATINHKTQPTNDDHPRLIKNNLTNIIPTILTLLTTTPPLTTPILHLLTLITTSNERNKTTLMRHASHTHLHSPLLETHFNPTAKLIAILCRYDDPTAESSAAHDHALRFVTLGVLPILHERTREALREVTATTTARSTTAERGLMALRALSINDDIIRSLAHLGITQTVTAALQLVTTSVTPSPLPPHLPIALLRNLCQNDALKTTLCLPPSPLVPLLLRNLSELHPSDPLVTEHSLAVLSAMSLRNSSNATFILIQCDATPHILNGMRRFPSHVAVQRQGCLAIRNGISRCHPGTEEGDALRDRVRELGGVAVISDGGRFGGSVDEAYAALRDLGCEGVGVVRVGEDGVRKGVEMFGEGELRFRKEFGESGEVRGRIGDIVGGAC